MSDSIPLELILIVGGAAISFLMFILICFCTRNRIDDRQYNQQGHRTYVGAPIAWFQRYKDRNSSKTDEHASPFDNRL